MLCRLYFKVGCHGAVEITYLNEEEIASLPSDFRINFTTAFRAEKPQLTHG